MVIYLNRRIVTQYLYNLACVVLACISLMTIVEF